MAMGYGVAVPKPAKGSSRRARLTSRQRHARAMRTAVWIRARGLCEVCGAGPLTRTLDVLDPRAGHVAHLRARRVAPEDRFNPEACRLKCRSCHLGGDHGQRWA